MRTDSILAFPQNLYALMYHGGSNLNVLNHLPRGPNILLARKIFYCPTIFMHITGLFLAYKLCIVDFASTHRHFVQDCSLVASGSGLSTADASLLVAV